MIPKEATKEFRVPWSVRFFLRRGDPHALPAFLKISHLIDKPSQKRGSPVKSTALQEADLELVERAYTRRNVEDKELARLSSIWHLVDRRKQLRLYKILIVKMMLKEGASRKNALLFAKLLQLEKRFWSSLSYVLTTLIEKSIWLVLWVFFYVALKTRLLSFLFHSRILGRSYDWAQSQKSKRKLKKKGFSQKLLNTLLSPFHILIEKVIFQTHSFAIVHYASLKNPSLPHYIGGHGGVTHSDEAALAFLKKQFSVKSMIDVGCGTGGQVDAARKKGIESFGVDGDSSLKFNEPWFFIHDFAKGKFPCKRRFDLVWSVEFLEHVEEKYQPFYMSLFQRANVVACTAAPHGRSGYHHVNCRDLPYWIKTFKKYGFAFDAKNTERLKEISSMRGDFIRQRGMLFVKA